MKYTIKLMLFQKTTQIKVEI